MSEGMDLSNVIFGSNKGINARELIFDNLKDSEFDKGISNDLDFENLVKLTEKLSQQSLDIVKHIKNFSFDSVGLLEKILDHDKKSVKLRTEDDVRRDELIKKISNINEKTLDLTKDIKKEEKKLKREKKEALKELPDSSDVSVARESITGNAFTKSIKLKMFDLQKGFSDSVASIPFFGESLSEKFSPEDENQLKVEKFKKLDSEIEKKKSAATLAKGERKISLEKQIAEMESQKDSISDELGDSIKDLNKTDDKLAKLEFDKLLHETNSQNEILEEIKTLLGEDIGDELKLELQEKASLIEKEKNNKIDELIKLQDQQSQTLSQEKSAELQEEEVARAEERTFMKNLFESLTGEESDKSSDSDKSGSSFMMIGGGKGGLLGWAKSFGGYILGSIFSILGMGSIWQSILKKGFIPYMKQYLSVMLKRSLRKGFLKPFVGMLTKMTSFLVPIATSIGTAFASMASALSAMLAPLLPAIAIAAAIALLVYSIKEAFDEMFEVFDSTGSIVETLKAGMSRFVGTMLGLPLDLLKGVISYIAEWMGFEDFSKWLDSFSFADIITELYVKFLDYIEIAILGVNDFIKDLFGVDILGALGDFFDIFDWDGIMSNLKSYWESFKSKFSNIGEDLTSWFSESWQSFKTTFSELWGGLSSWISEKWEGLKTTLGEKWEEIKEKFGLDPIVTSIVDKVKSIFTMVIDKISSIGSSVLSFLAPIGIPKVELLPKIPGFTKKAMSIGPWYPFQGKGESPKLSEPEQPPQKTPDSKKTPQQLLEEATESGLFIDGIMSNSIDQSKLKGASTEQLNSILLKGQGVLGVGGLDSKSLKALTEEIEFRKINESTQESIRNSVQQTSTNQLSNTLDSVQTDSNNIKLEKENKKSVEKSSGDSFSSVSQNNSRKYVSTNNYAQNKKIFSSQ